MDTVTLRVQFTLDSDRFGPVEPHQTTFSEPLAYLLEAIRSPAHTGPSGGDMSRATEVQPLHGLDLHILNLHDPHASRAFEIVQLVESSGRERERRRTAMTRLVDDIIAEARGELRNQLVRQYLRSLPRGLTRHEYRLREGDADLTLIEITASPGLASTAPAPRSVREVGTVVGIDFEPHTQAVRLVRPSGALLRLTATEEQIAAAMELRHAEVEYCGIIRGDEQSLVWIRAAAPRPDAPGPDERAALIEAWWGGLLDRLAH